jgi:excisionase family DNA binding protein
MTAAVETDKIVEPSARLAYSPAEACAVLGVSNTTIRTLLSTGRLDYTTAGSRLLISRTAIEDFLASPPEKRIARPGYAKRRNGT